MNILWLSANRLGYELLKEAVKLKNVHISAIVTLSGNSKTVMYDGIRQEKWKKFGTRVFETDQINDEKKLFKKLAPDLVIMCGWRQVVDRDILNIPKRGFIGFHPTLLPVGRGPAPIINSLLKGYKQSGVTMFYVSDGLDNGDIIGQEKFTIKSTDHAEDLYKKITGAAKKLIRIYLPRLLKGNVPGTKQDDSMAVVFDKPSLKDNRIDLAKNSIDEIFFKIKALSLPYKGAYIEKDGKKLIIWKAELIE